jgi:hypothetical protein
MQCAGPGIRHDDALYPFDLSLSVPEIHNGSISTVIVRAGCCDSEVRITKLKKDLVRMELGLLLAASLDLSVNVTINDCRCLEEN